MTTGASRVSFASGEGIFPATNGVTEGIFPVSIRGVFPATVGVVQQGCSSVAGSGFAFEALIDDGRRDNGAIEVCVS